MRKAIRMLFILASATGYFAFSRCGTSSLPDRSTVAVFGILTSDDLQPLLATIIDAKSGSETETLEDGTFNFLADASKNTLQLIVILDNKQQGSLTISQIAPNQEYRTALRFNLRTNMITTDEAIDSPIDSEVPGTKPEGPTVDPTPPTSDSDFDANGNTTSFAIPPGLKGNIGEGRQQWRNRCQECHPVTQNGRGYSFRRIQREIKNPPMNLSLPDRVLADITAYLNR
jgi:hypothetical protein